MLLILLTIFQHKDANVPLTMVVLTVTLTCAQTLSVAAELVLVEPVNVTKATTTTKMFALTCVKVSIVEQAVTVLVVTVLVKQIMSKLKIFVKRHVHWLPVRNRSRIYGFQDLIDYLNKIATKW